MDKTEIPVVKMKCDEHGLLPDMASIHFVDQPAIMETWLLFNKAEFAFAIHEDKRIITAPVMIPDLPIKRFQPLEEGGPAMMFYVVADAETVANTAKMYARNGKLNTIGLMHEDKYPDGVFMFESYITDKEKGVKAPSGYEHLPNGTWFMSFLVDNNDVWAAAKEGRLNGISLQSQWMLEFSQVPDYDSEDLAAIEAIEEDLEKIKNILKPAI